MKEVTKEVIEKLIQQKDELCVSIYMPTKTVAGSKIRKMPIQLKTLLNQVKKELQDGKKMDTREVDQLLKPAVDLIGDRTFWQNQKEGLAIFIQPQQFNYFRLPAELPEKATVSEYFDIIPLLPDVMFNRTYYVLTLSRNQNRFFRCTQGSIEKIEIEGIPESIQDILQFDEPEKTLQYHSNTSGRAIFHGHGDEVDDDRREELLKYFRQIEQGLTKYLNQKDKKEKYPLLVMCVQELFPLYKEINNYSYLLEQYIEGNPDEINPDSIRKSAWNIVKGYFHNQLEDIMKLYHDLKGTGKISSQLEDIISASYFSRVENLLIKKNISRVGMFDPEENKVSIDQDGNEQSKSYDLYNFSAIHTISNGGQVYVLEEEQMPDGQDIIAMYRY